MAASSITVLPAAALFGAGARLVIEPNLPHGVVAAIEIPR